MNWGGGRTVVVLKCLTLECLQVYTLIFSEISLSKERFTAPDLRSSCDIQKNPRFNSVYYPNLLKKYVLLSLKEKVGSMQKTLPLTPSTWPFSCFNSMGIIILCPFPGQQLSISFSDNRKSVWAELSNRLMSEIYNCDRPEDTWRILMEEFKFKTYILLSGINLNKFRYTYE